jgi:hypothetical protein
MIISRKIRATSFRFTKFIQICSYILFSIYLQNETHLFTHIFFAEFILDRLKLKQPVKAQMRIY